MGEHPALKNLFKQVVSGSFGWERWGLLGVLSDCILNYVKGDILEIGAGESSIIFSKLSEKYDRMCDHVEYSKSGVENMRHTKGYFGKNSTVYNCKSDEYFKRYAGYMKPTYALAFIDGDHSYEGVKRDFANTMPYVVPNGVVFLHDTLPPTKDWTVDHKCGGVFKLRMELEKSVSFDVFTFPFTAFNVGLTMVNRRPDREWEDIDG
jgi:hypothetical protein